METWVNASKEEQAILFSTSIHNPVVNDIQAGYVTTSIIMAIFMILGNGIILLLFYQERHTLKIPHKFIISMAVCDFITGLIFMPMIIYKSLGRVTCDQAICAPFVAILSAIYQTSMFVVTACCCDRFWAVVFPVHYRNNMKPILANIIIVVTWIIPWMSGLLQWYTALIPAYKDLVCVMSPRIVRKELLTYYMFSMIFHLLVVLILYVFIHRAILKAYKMTGRTGDFLKQVFKLSFLKNSEKNEEEMEEVTNAPLKMREIRNTLLVLLVVAFNIIAFLPACLHVIIISIRPDLFRIQDRLVIYIFLTLNSVIDPFLYALNIKNIRDSGKKLLYKIFCCKDFQTESDTTITSANMSTSNKSTSKL